MTISIELDRKSKIIRAAGQSSIDTLKGGSFGNMAKGSLELRPEEALYVLDSRRGECTDTAGKKVAFDELAAMFDSGKLISRYFTYKDWRDRGLISRYVNDTAKRASANKQAKMYRASATHAKVPMLNGTFFPESLTTIISDPDSGRGIYESSWIGQYGTYKTQDHGTMNKLDIYEAMFLMDSGKLSVGNAKRAEIFKIATDRRSDFPKLYDVYSDWRSKGYVIKTGFKFGTHFRVYFPGAKPMQEGGKWVHSMHVIHVFPRDAKLLISEWARAIRVAHSVRKTFILAIPGKSRTKKMDIDFVLYHRQNNNIEVPGESAPRFGMLSLSEEEYIGGAELSAVIGAAKKARMELIVAIADRETAVTYYKVRRIELQGSDYEYYEIDWMQP